MTPGEVKGIAESAAREAVREVLLTLGINANDPIAMQSDFAVIREVGKLVRDPEFRKDIEHTRAWRLALGQIRSKSIAAAIGILVTGGLAAFWAGLRVKFGQ